jgi:hypothetical protein
MADGAVCQTKAKVDGSAARRERKRKEGKHPKRLAERPSWKVTETLYNYDQHVPCPRCGSYDNIAAKTLGQIQSRKCRRCDIYFKNIGKPVIVDVTDLPKR